MQTSLRSAFLIVAAAAVLDLSLLKTCLILIGYWCFERLDLWLAKRVKDAAIADVMDGWETNPEYPEDEDKGGLTRVKLSGPNQIIVARVAELLRRVP
jgi:hypothetical protein